MQQAYLGGTLPVEKYTFLVYHSSGPEGSRLGDGLEHGNSTLCLIQSPKVEDMPGFVQEITAHEFFHILAPLNIHSDMVQNFDYLNPKFDKHLWLYEGVTEYMTMVYDVKNGENSIATLCERITAKVKEADKYDQKLSLADLSRQAMSRQDQYGNIYQKGALVGLCIDIKLRQATMGVSGLQDMMKNLLAAYGKDKSFQEKPFFDIVAKHSQPDMYYFLRDVVEDNKPMPLAHFLAEVGLKLDPKDNSVYPSEEGSATQRTLRLWWIGK
jgi:predicted metalloprotease with PDZ domain